MQGAGVGGVVTVAQYDRGTSQAEREALRRNPPHILLTNYMMLEYLLVRPADRDGIFANHRCRYLVLDEIHTYRGTLGANIALLVRRLQAHLRRARQDWLPQVPEAEHARRYPALVPVGTSATIKSLAVEGLSPDEARRQRDEDVQGFFARLTGADPATIRVFGEDVEEIAIPAEAAYPPRPTDPGPLDPTNPEGVRLALCRLAGVPANTPVADAARRCRLIWDLNHWLVAAPLSVSQLVAKLRAEVPARHDVPEPALRREVEAALLAGAALPDGVPGALRLRAHRFIRGGWRFHRCLNPNCGRLYPMGEERCAALQLAHRARLHLPQLRRRLPPLRRRPAKRGPAPQRAGDRRAGVAALRAGPLRVVGRRGASRRARISSPTTRKPPRDRLAAAATPCRRR